MQGVSGITGAAPLFRDIMLELHRSRYPAQFIYPSTLERHNICLLSGMIARTSCPHQIEEIFIPGTSPTDSCHKQKRETRMALAQRGSGATRGSIEKLTILNPGDGDIFMIDPQVSAASQSVTFRLRADDSTESVRLILDGKTIATEKYPYEFQWQPTRGEHMLEARTGNEGAGVNDRVAFSVF